MFVVQSIRGSMVNSFGDLESTVLENRQHTHWLSNTAALPDFTTHEVIGSQQHVPVQITAVYVSVVALELLLKNHGAC